MKLEMSRKNIFDIQNPQEITCRVWSYFVSHSRLLFRGYKDSSGNDEFYLDFEMVEYFEGPLSWKGADFYLGSSDECSLLLQQRGFTDYFDDYWLEHYHLYKVDLSNTQSVKILAASNAYKTTSIPPDYTWLIETESD